jgi:hypothetical protein
VGPIAQGQVGKEQAEMEAGQLLHNNPVGYSAQDFTAALVTAIRDELSRVYWNVNQKKWKGGPSYDGWSSEDQECSYEPLPPGIEWRDYYNWGGSPDDADWDQGEANKPNFSFEGVEVRWYKRFGRSMNVNVVWPGEKWMRWFERCMQTIYAYESHNTTYSCSDPVPYPNPEGKVPLDAEEADLRHVELMEKCATLEAQINSMACVCLDVAGGKKPRFDKEDWRWCQALDWVVRLGIHALKAPGKLKLHDK